MTLTAFSLAGHTILITGASSGIGRTISIRASQMGARVVLLGRDMTRLDETLAMLDGKDHLSVSMDLLKLHEIESALTPLLKSTGPLHGFVHSAGMAPTVLLRDLDTDRTEYLMRLNWLSFMALSRRRRWACRASTWPTTGSPTSWPGGRWRRRGCAWWPWWCAVCPSGAAAPGGERA